MMLLLLWCCRSRCCLLITQGYDQIARLLCKNFTLICGRRAGLIWNLSWFLAVRYSYGEDGFVSCDQQHHIEAMTKTWLLEGHEAVSAGEVSKVIKPCKLPLMRKIPLLLQKSQRIQPSCLDTKFGELLYLSASTPCLKSVTSWVVWRDMTIPTQESMTRKSWLHRQRYSELALRHALVSADS